MRRTGLLAAGALLLGALSGCGGNDSTTGPGTKTACEACTTDSECRGGLLCRDYGMVSGNALGHFCSTSGTGSACTIRDTPGLLPIDRR